jgi:hypothetical protein
MGGLHAPLRFMCLQSPLLQLSSVHGFLSSQSLFAHASAGGLQTPISHIPPAGEEQEPDLLAWLQAPAVQKSSVHSLLSLQFLPTQASMHAFMPLHLPAPPPGRVQLVFESAGPQVPVLVQVSHWPQAPGQQVFAGTHILPHSLGGLPTPQTQPALVQV